MIEAEKNICPSCGSALSVGQTNCDICGEDLASPRPAPSAPKVVPAADVVENKPAAAKKVAKKKVSPTVATKGAYFSTVQWIILCVASFVLGGVLAVTFLPSSGDTADSPQQEVGVQQQGGIDLGRLDELRSYVQNNPDDLDAKLRFANDLHDAKLLDQAIAQYKEYLAKQPDNPDARVDLGICYFELKQYPAAIAEMEQAVAGHPDHQLGNYNLGIVNLNAGNHDAAKSWFIKARDLDPSSPYGINAKQLLETEFSAGN
jgi:TolA-binding protein